MEPCPKQKTRSVGKKEQPNSTRGGTVRVGVRAIKIGFFEQCKTCGISLPTATHDTVYALSTHDSDSTSQFRLETEGSVSRGERKEDAPLTAGPAATPRSTHVPYIYRNAAAGSMPYAAQRCSPQTLAQPPAPQRGLHMHLTTKRLARICRRRQTRHSDSPCSHWCARRRDAAQCAWRQR